MWGDAVSPGYGIVPGIKYRWHCHATTFFDYIPVNRDCAQNDGAGGGRDCAQNDGVGGGRDCTQNDGVGGNRDCACIVN
jgi:hypothetical protein